MWAYVEDNQIINFYKFPKPITLNGIQYPKEIFTLWTVSEQLAIGIYPVVKAEVATPDLNYYNKLDPIYTVEAERVLMTPQFTEANVDNVKTNLIEKVKSLHDQKVEQGFVWNDQVLDIDAKAQRAITAEYNASIDTTNIPSWEGTYVWRDFQNNFFPLDRANMTVMALAARSHVRSLAQKKWDLQVTISNCTTVAEAANVAIATGWPQTAVEYLE